MAIALQQTLCRFTLWIACHGVFLPWYGWAETNVPVQTLERYRRRAMVARLRAQRFKIARGPFILRGVLENLFTFLRFMQFPATVSFKFVAALLVCLFPLIVFFVVRIYLPVPQRMARVGLDWNRQNVGTAEVLHPNILRLSDFNFTANRQTEIPQPDGFFHFREIDGRSGEGIFTQGKSGAHEEMWRGWRLSAGADLLAQFSGEAQIRTLRLKYKVMPNKLSNAQCRIDVTTDVGQFIFASSFSTTRGGGFGFLKSPLTRRLQEKLMPNLAGNQAHIESFPIALPVSGNTPSLRFRTSRLDEGDARACDVLLYGFEWVRQSLSQASSNKRNLLMLIFNALSMDLASDAEVMPWMSSVLRSPNGYIFNQHHALDVRDDHSFRHLMGLSSDGISSFGNAEFNLVERLRRLGYKIVFMGDFDSADFRNQILPDIAVRINNETYQPRLTLTHLLKTLEEESTTPIFVLLRFKGMQSPWWPVFTQLEFQKMFFGGRHRGVMDTLLDAHARSLDDELSFHFSQLKNASVFSKFDFLLTAERGLDLGLNLGAQESMKATFTSDLLLNQESLRVPLVYVPASNQLDKDNQIYKFIQSVTTHSDLARTLWETLGITDFKFPVEARRLWQNTVPGPARERPAFSSLRDTLSLIKAFPLHSRIQEGVLFADPDSTGGFLKYVSQAVPIRISVPDAFGWPTQQALTFPSGEQFRQVSRRGTREEILGRVNSSFVRESRRVIRLGRRLPLRFRFEFQDKMQIDLTFSESGGSAPVLKAELPEGLKLTTSVRVDSVYVHKITGQVSAGERMDLFGGVTQLQFVENGQGSLFVACPEAFIFTAQALNAAVAQKSVCLLETPSAQRMAHLRTKGNKLISVWLVEDEKQNCVTQNEGDDTESEYLECTSAEAAQRVRN